jgi:hypothetical protein
MFQQEVPTTVALFQGAGDFKAVIPEVLWTTFLGKPISLDDFANIFHTRNDHQLTMSLAVLLTSLMHEMKALKPKLYKRQFFIDWLESCKDRAPKDGCLAAREQTVDLIILTGCIWLENILQSLQTFDFIFFLHRHKGNWHSMWNLMVLFFLSCDFSQGKLENERNRVW